MRVALTAAGPAEVPLLRRLMQLDLYDLARSTVGICRTAGRTGWPTGSSASGPNRVAGFALVRRGGQTTAEPDVHEVSELFVLRRYRRRGVGAQVARAVFDSFPGRWEVLEMASNVEAQAFRRAVIGPCTAGRFEDFDWQQGGVAYRVPRFDTGRR